MSTAKVFVTGRSQAVRLPKEFRFEADEVGIARLGELVILYPKKRGWDVLETGLRHFTEDYMAERNQPAEAEEREAL